MTSDLYPLRVDRRVFVPTSDGARIAVTLYLPDAPGEGPFPAIVESVPYRKDDDCVGRDYSMYAYLAQRGFAGIRIDIRGTGASTGIIEDEYTRREHHDNIEVMEWAVAQDWCDGNLGMWGVSWGGFNSLQTAMLRPPHLKAITAMHATHDRFACDVHHVGGSFHALEQMMWPALMIATNGLPPDPDIFGDGWHEEWMARLEETPQWPLEWLHHQRRDDFWLHGSPCADYEAIECPTLLIGGWLDGYVDGIVALAEHLKCPRRTVIGPWGHYRPATGVPKPRFDHFDLMARWFGHHLRGDDNGVMDLPALTAYIRNEAPYDSENVVGYWRSEVAYPPADLRIWEVAFGDLDHDELSWNGPQWVGSHAPAWDRGGFPSNDPAPDDSSSLTFDTGPLSEPLEILGVPMVTLTVSTDTDLGMVAARLLAIDPDGSAHLICRGNRNLAFPEDLSNPQPVIPGKPMTITFPLMAASAVMPKGWGIRLSVSGADFPIVWPPPRSFTLSVEPGTSKLELPTVPVRDPELVGLEFPPVPQPITPPITENRSESGWSVDRADKRTIYTRHIATSEHQPTRSGLTYDYDQTVTVGVDDDDPASTVAHSEVQMRLNRPGWDVATKAEYAIEGGDPLRVTIELTAMYQGEPIWNKTWRDEVPRVWA